MPHKILGTKHMIRAKGLPPMPSPISMNGEKQKAVIPGWVVLFIRLVRPKSPPRNAPFFGPRTTDPMITGMWIVVACIASIGSFMYPIYGTKASSTISAESSAVCASSSVFVCFMNRFLLMLLFLFRGYNTSGVWKCLHPTVRFPVYAEYLRYRLSLRFPANSLL